MSHAICLDFAHSGLRCVVARMELGHLCGYVAVPEGHPLFGNGYSDESASLESALAARLEQPVGNSFPAMLAALSGNAKPTPDLALEVHGGLTFSGGSHFGIGLPLREARARCDWDKREIETHKARMGQPTKYPVETDEKLWWFGFDANHCWDHDDPKDVPYMEAECRKLADQLALLA